MRNRSRTSGVIAQEQSNYLHQLVHNLDSHLQTGKKWAPEGWPEQGHRLQVDDGRNRHRSSAFQRIFLDLHQLTGSQGFSSWDMWPILPPVTPPHLKIDMRSRSSVRRWQEQITHLKVAVWRWHVCASSQEHWEKSWPIPAEGLVRVACHLQGSDHLSVAGTHHFQGVRCGRATGWSRGGGRILDFSFSWWKP